MSIKGRLIGLALPFIFYRFRFVYYFLPPFFGMVRNTGAVFNLPPLVKPFCGPVDLELVSS